MTQPHSSPHAARRRRPPLVTGTPTAQAPAQRRETGPAAAPATSASSPDEVLATPRVRQLASQLGVNLAAIAMVGGTGAGGRITTSDVRAAHALRHRSAQDAYQPITSRRSPHTDIAATASAVEIGRTVQIDRYALNPYLDDARQVAPDALAAARRNSQPPTLFETGDLPVFTASGAEPSILLNLPWDARHWGARASQTDLAAALNSPGALVEITLTGQPISRARSDGGGNGEYRTRFMSWLRPRTVWTP